MANEFKVKKGLIVEGNASASGDLEVRNITASGNISASGDLLLKGPSSRIHVVDSNDGNYGIELLPTNGPMINFGDTDIDLNSLMTFGAFSGTNNINTRARDFHLFGTTTTTGFYFHESTGKFGIGTTSPTGKLTVYASGSQYTGSNSALFLKAVNDDVSFRIGQSPQYGFEIKYKGTDSNNNNDLEFLSDAQDHTPSGGTKWMNVKQDGQIALGSGSLDDGAGVIFLPGSGSDYAGNVGIGTTSPSATLHITSSNNPNLLIEDPNGSQLLRLKRTDNNKYFNLSLEGDDLRFIPGTTDGSQNIIIGSDAASNKIDSRLGIGTATPNVELEVSGSISASGDLEARNITASNIQVTNDIALGGNIFSFSGFSFIEGVSANFSGSNVFGSGSSPGANDIAGGGVAHQFTGSVSITGSALTINGHNILNSIDAISTTTGSLLNSIDAISTTTGSLLNSIDAISTTTGSLLNASASFAADIITNAANTFKATGIRSGDSTITGSLTLRDDGGYGGALTIKSGSSSGETSRNIFRIKLRSGSGHLQLNNGANWGLQMHGIGNTPAISAFYNGAIEFRALSSSNGSFGNPELPILMKLNFNGAGPYSGSVDIDGELNVERSIKITAIEDNTSPFIIKNIDGEDQLNFRIDQNQHADLHIYKEGIKKITLGTYWPSFIDNDGYESIGGLILGSDTIPASSSGYGLYISAGPDSGSIFAPGLISGSTIHMTGDITGNNIISNNHLSTDFLKSVTYPNNNYLDLDDDTVTNANGVGLFAISSMVFGIDSNGNATNDSFKWKADGANGGAGSELMELTDEGDLTVNGNITASGNISASNTAAAHVLGGDLSVGPTGNKYIRVGSNSNGGKLLFGSTTENNSIVYGSNQFQIKTTQAGGIVFYTDGPTDRGRITDGGEFSFSGSIHGQSHITASGDISASGDLEARNITASNIQVANDIALGGNIFSFSGFSFIEGVSANFSGSNKFGSGSSPGANDIAGGGVAHQFTGSVAITGSSLSINGLNVLTASPFTAVGISGSWQGENFVSASQTFLSTGQRNGDSGITGSLELSGNGHITASGNISASGNIEANTGSFNHINNTGHIFMTETKKISFGDSADAADTNDQYIQAFEDYLIIEGDDAISFKADDIFKFEGGANMVIGTGYNLLNSFPPEKLTVEGNISASGNIITEGHITASGNISASGDLFANNLTLIGDLTATSATAQFTNITASGNISSSGKLTADDFQIIGTPTITTVISSSNNSLNIGSPIIIDNGKSIIYKDSSGNNKILFSLGTNDVMSFGPGDQSIDGDMRFNNLSISSSNNFIVSSSTIQLGSNANTHVTASGNISASGTLLGQNILIDNGDSGHATLGLHNVGNEFGSILPITGSGLIISQSFTNEVTHHNMVKIGETELVDISGSLISDAFLINVREKALVISSSALNLPLAQIAPGATIFYAKTSNQKAIEINNDNLILGDNSDSTTVYASNLHLLPNNTLNMGVGSNQTDDYTYNGAKSLLIGQHINITNGTTGASVKAAFLSNIYPLFKGNITASAVSSSGNLFASLSLDSSALNTVMYNTTTGQFFHTGSYGGGSGGGGADNLGNHTATEDLDLATFSIKGITNITASGVISSSKDALINGLTIGRGGGDVSVNTAIGDSTLINNEASGQYNTALGNAALYANTTGVSNTAVGYKSMYDNLNGDFNTAIGLDSLSENQRGDANAAVGYNSGRFIANGTNPNIEPTQSVFIGMNTKAKTNNDENQIVIGYDAVGEGSNSVVLGNDSITKTVLKGNITASGNYSGSATSNLIVGGTINGKMPYFTHHNFDAAYNNKRYIPINSLSENTSIGEENIIIAPHDGIIKKLMIYCESDAGSTVIYSKVNASEVGYVAVNLPATTTTTFPINRSFNSGDIISLGYDPTNIPNDMNVTCVWEYDTNT